MFCSSCVVLQAALYFINIFYSVFDSLPFKNTLRNKEVHRPQLALYCILK